MRLLTAQRHRVRLEEAANETGGKLGSLRWVLDHGKKFGSHFKNNRKHNWSQRHIDMVLVMGNI